MKTIKEIAQLANVSPTTVSNVLHGRTSKMAEETRKRVQQVLEDENYSTNMGALILAHKNSQIIGVILNYTERDNETVLQDPFEGMIIGTLEREIRHNNYYMMFHVSENTEEVLRLAQSWKIDGLVIIGLPADGCREIKERTDTPIVFIDCYFNKDESCYHNVGLNDYAGGRKMAEYLIQSGHRDILFLADNKVPSGVDLMRLKGFQAVLEKHKIPWKDDYFFPISRSTAERHRQYESILAKLKNWSALFFASDYYAADAVAFFSKRGVRVPEDISLVGFDDNIYASMTRPALTTVRQDVREKGELAVRKLLQLINDEDVVDANTRLEPELIIRDSVKKRE